MQDENIARRLLIEQVKKEVLADILQYQVGWCHNGEMLTTKTSGEWQGYIFVIPDDKYPELFK